MTLRERRLAQRVAARGDEGLVDALLELKGVVFGSRYRCDSLYDIGAEGAVFVVTDRIHPQEIQHVAKVPLMPFHEPFNMTQSRIVERRRIIALEARYLAHSGAPSLPKHVGTYDFQNPLIDSARGGAFAELDPVVVMEKLPGQDLDRWLARAHRSQVPLRVLRPALDRLAVGLLRALVDLLDRGLVYADLRPANLRMLPQPRRHVRLLDAGSLVPVHDGSGRFPHVPSYLPPAVLDALDRGEPVQPDAAIQAIMCGRTLYEIATGNVPRAGEPIDEGALASARVSVPVAEAVRRLASGQFERVDEALDYLTERARAAASRRLMTARTRTTVTSTRAAVVQESPKAREDAADQSASRPVWRTLRRFFARMIGRAGSRGPQAPVW